MKDVLCLAVADTYDMVINTDVTAHPVASPFPTVETPYLIPIKKGGSLEYLYKIKKIIVVNPKEIESCKNQLDETDYIKILEYYIKRNRTFGFGRDCPYRFYILEDKVEIEQPFFRRNIQCSVKLNYEDIPIKTKI